MGDASGKVKLCFLPAEVNKVQVAETERFHGFETVLQRKNINSFSEGPTSLVVELTPKAMAAMSVHVFSMPRSLPPADSTDGIIDWANEARDNLPQATVEVTPMKEGA